MGDIMYIPISNAIDCWQQKHIPVTYLPILHLICTRFGLHMDSLVRFANSLHLDVAIKVAFLLRTAEIRCCHKSLRASRLSVEGHESSLTLCIVDCVSRTMIP